MFQPGELGPIYFVPGTSKEHILTMSVDRFWKNIVISMEDLISKTGQVGWKSHPWHSR